MSRKQSGKTEHQLKTLPAYWDAIARGEKNFDVRRDDRGFQKGDVLVLLKFDPDRHPGFYMKKNGDFDAIRKVISYVLRGGQLGIEPGYVVMGLQDE